MFPARFLMPWEMLEMDFQDTKRTTLAGNRNVLVVVDRALKFLFPYALPSKESLGC